MRRTSIPQFRRNRRLSLLGRPDEISVDLRSTGRNFRMRGDVWPTAEWALLEHFASTPDRRFDARQYAVVNLPVAEAKAA